MSIRLVLFTVFLVVAPAGAELTAPNPSGETPETARAIFAGGCFWCMEYPFDSLEGVQSTTSGYTGGSKQTPTYDEVSEGGTGHTEAVEIVYDPAVVSFKELLKVFWRNIDPLTANAQFCDKGSQYRSGIFYKDEEQKRLAEQSRDELAKRFSESVVTEITEAKEFWPAEEYHQDYYQKNSVRYHFYRLSCRRDARLKELWGDEAGGGVKAH